MCAFGIFVLLFLFASLFIRVKNLSVIHRVSKKSKNQLAAKNTEKNTSEDTSKGNPIESAVKVWSFKNIAMAGLKWAFAGILLVIVFKSGKISLEPVFVFLKSPYKALPIVLIIWITAVGSFIRWQWILKGLGIRLSAWTAIRLGMTGQFFSIDRPLKGKKT